jgi:hypothetical protein
MAFWVTPPQELGEQLRCIDLNPESGMKGILHCVSRILPLFLTCDANDFDWSLGCRNAPWHTLFWFEFYLHGIGNSEQCYDRLEEILSVALEHLLTCDCVDGCPNCTSRLITPYHVRNIELGEGNEVFSRRAGVVILNSMLTGQSVAESVKLLDSPRQRRGQDFLPSVIDRPVLAEPSRMPLNERTRNLLLRKLERSRMPKPALDHSIELAPPHGARPEDEKTLSTADAERRSGRTAIRRSGDGLSKKLRRKLAAPQTALEPAAEPPPDTVGPKPIQAGDSVARRAARRRRKKTGQ